MPGVSISTSVRTGPTSNTLRSSSQAFIVGLAERGPSDAAVFVSSLAEFEQQFGGYVSYAYLQPTVQTFFEEGGTQAYIVRVVGPNATTGQGLLNEGGAGGDNVISLDAVGAGAWSANLEAVTSVSGAGRIVKLKYNGEQIFSTGVKLTAAGLVNAINNSSVASSYVTATLLLEALPEASTVTFTTGNDDKGDNTVDTSFTAYVDALELFNDAYGDGAVICPETHAINAQLVLHANEYSRVALLHGAVDVTVGDLTTAVQDIAAELNAEHVAMYYPWVYIPSDVPGINRLIPPTGYAAGKRALAHNQTGPHQPAAGLISSSNFVNGVYASVNRTLGDTLDAASINAIRVIANTVRIYGARSCSDDTDNFRFITAQDTVNTVVTQANTTLEDLVFSVIDARGGLFASITGRMISICENLKSLGALYEGFNVNGKKVDPGYTVKCDSSINSLASLSEGKINVQVGVRVSSIGDTIDVTIVKSNLSTTVTL